MTPRSGKIPSYGLHKATGQARVVLSGKDFYLGPYGSEESRRAYARLIAQRVRDQQVHHPRSAAKFVTVSVGVACCMPMRDQPVSLLVGAAEAALARAKTAGRNQVAVAEKGDYVA